MERQGHDYAAASAMAYAQQQRQAANMQQQQQFGFHPQHQQFPSSVHGPPFLPPGPGPAHPSLQQFPYHHALQQQQQLQQLHPHAAPPPPHILLQQQHQAPPAFPPHFTPPLVPSPFYDSAPPPVAPPSDPELHKRIDKLVEYAVKNGPDFEAMICEKQRDNPSYSFLFGGEGHGYYRYKLWLSTRPGGPFNPPFPSSSVPMIHPPPNPNPMMGASPLNAPPMNPAGIGSSPPILGPPPYPQFYDQHHHHQHPQSFGLHGRPEYDQSSKSFKGLSGPLPSDVAMELSNVLNNLNGTKESIKGAKLWFMQRSPFAPALAEALRDRVFQVDDVERQLHIIYLANDILFDSLNRRTSSHDLDNEAHAFKPVLGSMLARIYHNPQSNEEYRKRLQQMVEFWASKEVFDQETISLLKGEMIGGPQTNSFPGASKDLSSASADSGAGMLQTPPPHIVQQWQAERLGSGSGVLEQDRPDKHVTPGQSMPASLAAQQFLPNSAPPSAFPGSMPIPSSGQPANQPPGAHLLPPPSSSTSEQLPPYPLFPPGLIPGMVRKMQIGSGVPYSPLSPLDIPTMIPPSTVPPSEILQRVSKFFKEIGEVNPSEGPMNSDSRDDDDDEYEGEYERESPVRKGGACIPPPPNLQQVDPETGTFADGSVDRKPGSSSSGRLGIGATANPNEVSQYDDVYTSYRKQRSTTYHSSMSARAVAR